MHMRFRLILKGVSRWQKVERINRIPYAQVDFAFIEDDFGSATQEVGSNFERGARRN